MLLGSVSRHNVEARSLVAERHREREPGPVRRPARGRDVGSCHLACMAPVSLREIEATPLNPEREDFGDSGSSPGALGCRARESGGDHHSASGDTHA